MIRLFLLSFPLLVFGLGSALAQVKDVAKASAQASQVVLKNLSGEKITQARVQTKQGHVWNIGEDGLKDNQATQVAIPARDCIASVEVALANGRNMQSKDLNSCNETQIVVDADRISIPQQAVPGAQQHGTPR